MSYTDAHDDYSDQVLIAVITRCIEGHGLSVCKRVSTGDLEFLYVYASLRTTLRILYETASAHGFL